MPGVECFVARNEHGTFCIPRSSAHRRAALTVLHGKVYEPETIAFIQEHSGKGDVVHAGTYFGDFLPAISRTCHGHIWAFEPNIENYRCAQMTVQMNGLTNVTLTHAGLGDASGTKRLMTNDERGRALGGGSRFLDSQFSGDTTPDVNSVEESTVLSVDEFVSADRDVSLIHLDVEGYEQRALGGAQETITRHRPILILESLPDQDWFEENILSKGYRPMEDVHRNTVLSYSPEA